MTDTAFQTWWWRSSAILLSMSFYNTFPSVPCLVLNVELCSMFFICFMSVFVRICCNKYSVQFSLPCLRQLKYWPIQWWILIVERPFWRFPCKHVAVSLTVSESNAKLCEHNSVVLPTWLFLIRSFYSSYRNPVLNLGTKVGQTRSNFELTLPRRILNSKTYMWSVILGRFQSWVGLRASAYCLPRHPLSDWPPIRKWVTGYITNWRGINTNGHTVLQYSFIVTLYSLRP